MAEDPRAKSELPIIRPPGSQSLDRVSGVNDFESQIFSKGTLNFDFSQFVAEAENKIRGVSDRLNSLQKYSPENIGYFIEEEVDDAHYEMIWRQRYSGQIPADWIYLDEILDDFEVARKQGIQLSPTLVDAGLTHRSQPIVAEVGISQVLNTNQIAYLFARPGFFDSYLDEIIAAQRKMGVTEEQIQEAQKWADEAKRHMKQKGVGDRALDDSLPAIRPLSEKP